MTQLDKIFSRVVFDLPSFFSKNRNVTDVRVQSEYRPVINQFLVCRTSEGTKLIPNYQGVHEPCKWNLRQSTHPKGLTKLAILVNYRRPKVGCRRCRFWGSWLPTLILVPFRTFRGSLFHINKKLVEHLDKRYSDWALIDWLSPKIIKKANTTSKWFWLHCAWHWRISDRLNFQAFGTR